MKQKNQGWKDVLGFLLSLFLFAAVLGAVGIGIMFFSGKNEERGADTLKNAIRRASVQCYAIEGRYPPSVDYLEENYGVIIDRERYDVFYEGFASNIMPDITVHRHEP